MPKKSTWQAYTALGQRWYWFNQEFFDIYGFDGTVLLYEPTVTTEDMQKIDAKLDDGVASTGSLRYSNNGMILYGMN